MHAIETSQNVLTISENSKNFLVIATVLMILIKGLTFYLNGLNEDLAHQAHGILFENFSIQQSSTGLIADDNAGQRI